ncbi:MAG: hypothetical protein IJ532_04965 [Alphaproteobacteria bacterium]|nr:hypothetical protein [Alphaproteobacteria bacterium]
MNSNYGFSDWLADMDNFWEFSLSVLPWRLLTFAVIFFVISVVISLFLCIRRSLFFDLATKDDIIQDRRQCPNSWYFGEDYEKVRLSKIAMCEYMLCANLSYHIFWNVVVMGRWRVCGAPHNEIYFRVNRFSDNNWDIFLYLKRLFLIFSLSFIWGYVIFLIITALRLIFCKKPLC